jgi:hypothetical protein
MGDFADTCAKVWFIQSFSSLSTGAVRVWRIRLRRSADRPLTCGFHLEHLADAHQGLVRQRARAGRAA